MQPERSETRSKTSRTTPVTSPALEIIMLRPIGLAAAVSGREHAAAGASAARARLVAGNTVSSQAIAAAREGSAL
ncbi:hypothetical protein RugamoR1_28060 [Rugamonas sp. R1(2021)]